MQPFGVQSHGADTSRSFYVSDFTQHEITLMEQISDQNRVLMPSLTKDERKSMEHYVTPENFAQVQETIGSDENIEDLLFWDRGGKFDDASWAELSPVGDADKGLMDFVSEKVRELRELAVEMQRRSDLTLYSQFNKGLLFTGVSGAVRCDDQGTVDASGTCYSGVEMRMIGSTGDMYNSISIMPGTEGYLVHYGAHEQGKGQGLTVNTADAFTLIQLAQMLGKDMEKNGLDACLLDSTGQAAALDAKVIRKAARKGEALDFESTMVLACEKTVPTLEEAFDVASRMCQVFYERFGLESEVFNLGRLHGNFTVCRNENYADFIKEAGKKKGMVFLTATLVCRRCRREVEGFALMAQKYPDVQFALVNMNAPHTNFHEHVYADMAGGDPDQFVLKAKGVTPFTIIYTPDGNGGITYQEYFATGKTEVPPSPEYACSILDKYFA